MNQAERFRLLTSQREVKANLRQKSVRAALFTAAASFGDFALRIGSTAVLARLVIPEHFGLVMMIMAIIAIAEQFRELGLSTATVQREHITHEEVSNLFWINLGASLAISIALCAASPLIAAYYRDPRLIAITCALATTVVFGGAIVQHQALLTRQLKLGQTSTIRLLTSLVSTVFSIALAWADFGYWALVWREVARAVLLTTGIWWCFPWIPGLPCRQASVRGLLRFGVDLTGANLLAALAASVDRFLLGRMWGPTPVAVYRQSYQLVAAATDQLLSPLYQVTQPTLSILQNEPARFRLFYLRLLTLVCVLTMPLSLFVAVYSDCVTGLLLGSAWTEAASIVCILSFSTFIKQSVGSTAFILISRGRSATFLGLTVLNNAVLVASMAIGASHGIYGIAVAELFTTYIIIIPRLHYSLKSSPITPKIFLRTITRPVVSSLAMSYVLLGLRTYSPFASLSDNLVFASALASATFGGTWLLLPGGMSEALAVIRDLRGAVARTTGSTAPEKAALAVR